MRLLWADDQTRVAQTLSQLLDPLGAKIDFVEDGDQAISAVENRDYDLVLLDLRMPPGEWGGLTVLEAIQAREIRMPVIVISGEGDQAETIRAQRLGAKDYVTKESVEDELLERTKAVLADAIAERDRFLLEDAPSPMAVPLSRLRSADDPLRRLHRAIEFFETLLRFCVITGMAEVREAGSENVMVDLLGDDAQTLRRPSLGTFERARRALRGKAGSFFDSFDRLLPTTLERVVNVRNEVFHGTEPSNIRAEVLLAEFGPELELIRNRIWRRPTASLRVARSLEYEERRFAVHGISVRGQANTLTPITWVSDLPLPSGHVLLMNESDVLDLHPLVLAKPAQEPAAWQLLTFDGIDQQTRARPMRMRFVDLWTGTRATEDAATLAALAPFAL